MKPSGLIPVNAPLSYLLAGLLIGLPLSKSFEAAPTTLLFFSLLALLWARRKTGTKQWYLLFLLASILTAWAGEIRLTDNLRMPPEARLKS